LGRWLDRHHMEAALRKSEEQFRQLVENAFDAIYLMEDRHYSYVNSRFVEMTGFTEAELYDKDFRFDALLTPKSRLVAEQRYRARQSGEVLPAQYETQIQSRTGEVHDVEVSTVSIGTADKVLVMGIIRNITERKRAQTILKRNEHELQLKNEELQVLNEELTETNERIRLMNVQLKNAKEMAEAGDKLKTAFLNNISHEVRTPLNGILGATSLIADPSATHADRNEMLEIISISTQRLLRTITQYMDISLLSSNNMAIYPSQQRLENLLKPFMEEYAKACEMKDLRFETELPEKHAEYQLETDKSLVEKVLHHLLENAVKFTKTGQVRFGYELQGDEFKFFVADTGIGIDPAVHHKIFTEFTQEDSSNLRRYEGSGLGLAICKHSIELLHGRIWFETVKGEGTIFWFTIPTNCKPETTKPPVIAIENETATVPKLILYAEDEDSNFQVLNMLLRKKTNAHIIRAEDGQKAVDLCQSNPDIDLVLMDIKMPIMDGYEATLLIKAMRPELPIVAITAYGMSGDENKALRAGCDDYIAKPVGKDDLLRMVAKYGVVLK
jgi:PAS domain S-box-containing protein